MRARREFACMLGIYAEEVHRDWQRRQEQLAPTCLFPSHLYTGVDAKTRSVLVDWLWDIRRKLSVSGAATVLAIQLVDRYLAAGAPATRATLQCVGMACMSLASKMEEVEPCTILDLTYHSVHACTVKQVCETERVVCTALGYDFAMPTALHFVTYYSQCAAPGCTRVRRTALAALHALSLGDAWASAQPQLAAVGCVAWAIRDRNILLLPAMPAAVPAWEVELQAVHAEQRHRWTKAERISKQMHALTRACGLPGSATMDPHCRVLRSVVAACTPPVPGDKYYPYTSFEQRWMRSGQRARVALQCRRQLAAFAASSASQVV